MTTIRAAVPDDLYEALVAQAKSEQISVDALIARTLRSLVALPLTKLKADERAEKGDWADFDRIMERVPDVPPIPGDEL